jgi:hypothetical protein
MLHFFAGSINTVDLSLTDSLFYGLILAVYVAFWAVLIFIAYKAFRKFLKGDVRTRKQTLLAVFIVFMTLGFLPVTAGLWGWAQEKYYQLQYETCIEEYPYPDWHTPNTYMTLAEREQYKSSDYYINCQPLRNKAD